MADTAFAAESPGVLDAWLGVIAYAFQIYFDFSGYSDMAIGLGRMVGLSSPATSTPRIDRRASPSSGGAGTSPSRRSCATTCTSRSAATGSVLDETTLT